MHVSPHLNGLLDFVIFAGKVKQGMVQRFIGINGSLIAGLYPSESCPTETRNAHQFLVFSLTKHYLPWIKDGVETASPSANHSNSVRVMATIHTMFNLTS